MSELHKAYLNLGSNIQPEKHLVQAIKLLSNYGNISKISNAWESESVGAEGPNYLNACVLFETITEKTKLKNEIIYPIENQLDRVRSQDKYAPRTIDIDIILYDNVPYNNKFWQYPFVIVPLAELYPDYKNPILHETVSQTATRLCSQVWIQAHPEVLSQFSGGSFKGQN